MSEKYNHNICTWIYCEQPGEESSYAQVPGTSSSFEFQAVYWRCVAVYFASSLRHNPNAQHILFTNTKQIPALGDFDLARFFALHNIKVVTLPFTYQTPSGYFGAWRNQFYVFDILKYLSSFSGDKDQFIILDSDCFWANSATRILSELDRHGLLTYEPEQPFDEVTNGLSRLDMKDIFEELDHQSLNRIPLYFGGEWFAANLIEIRKVYQEFELLWPILLERFANQQPKFNEEAHALSYIYHKLGYAERTANPFFKRVWTSPQLYDACSRDLKLDVWHVLTEKRYGIKRFFNHIKDPHSKFWATPLGEPFLNYAANYLGIPHRTPKKILLDFWSDRKEALQNRLRVILTLPRL